MVSARFATANVKRALRVAPENADRLLRLALNRHGFAFRGEMNKRFGAQLSGPWKENTSDLLATRTGALKRSVGHTVFGQGRDLGLRVFIGDARTGAYAGIQEYGGTVRGNPWLTIPAPANLTAAGVVRYQRRLPDTFIVKNANGTLMVARKHGSGGLEVLWILKREVTIPARLGFRDTFQRMVPNLLTRLNLAAQKAMNESFGGGKSFTSAGGRG